MATVIHRFDPPDRFVAGTVGEPGQRTFFVQARTGNRLTSVRLEKEQVSILGERIDELLDELSASGETRVEIPQVMPESLIDNAALDQPIEEEFRAGTITLSWDTADERVVIEVFPVSDGPMPEPLEADEEELVVLPLAEPEPSELLVVCLPVNMARAFATRASQVVSAGREQCPFCGGPIDAHGHLCPRANGYRRRG